MDINELIKNIDRVLGELEIAKSYFEEDKKNKKSNMIPILTQRVKDLVYSVLQQKKAIEDLTIRLKFLEDEHIRNVSNGRCCK